MADQITISVPANPNTIAALVEQWKTVPLDNGCPLQCGRFLSPAEMISYLLACMTDEDSDSGQLLACVLLSGIPPLDLRGADWHPNDALARAGKIELIGEEGYVTSTLSQPAMNLLRKVRGIFSFGDLVFDRDYEMIPQNDIIDAFERIAARAEMPLLTIDDLVLSYQYIAFNTALFGTERSHTA